MAFSPDGKLAVATSELTSMAHVIDTSTYKLIANVLVDTRPRAALFEDSGKRFWVTSEVGGTLSVIDAATYTIVKRIGFEIAGVRSELIQPMGIRFSKDRSAVSLRSDAPTASPSSTSRSSSSPTTSWSASAPGTWRCRPTARSSTPPTGSPTTHDHRRGDAEGVAVRARRAPAVGHRAEAVRSCEELARHARMLRCSNFRHDHQDIVSRKLCQIDRELVPWLQDYRAPNVAMPRT